MDEISTQSTQKIDLSRYTMQKGSDQLYLDNTDKQKVCVSMEVFVCHFFLFL